MTFRADKLSPPRLKESEQELYRWRYRVFELLNGVVKILAEFVEATPSGTITGTTAQEIIDQVTTLLETHKTRHQDGGADEMSVAALSGLLADPQTPVTHATRHQDAGNDEVSVTGLSGLLADAQTPLAHKTSHQNGGADEINVAGLSGELAGDQPPKSHGNERHDPPSVFPIGSLFANLTGNDPNTELGYGTWYLVMVA